MITPRSRAPRNVIIPRVACVLWRIISRYFTHNVWRACGYRIVVLCSTHYRITLLLLLSSCYVIIAVVPKYFAAHGATGNRVQTTRSICRDFFVCEYFHTSTRRTESSCSVRRNCFYHNRTRVLGVVRRWPRTVFDFSGHVPGTECISHVFCESRLFRDIRERDRCVFLAIFRFHAEA